MQREVVQSEVAGRFRGHRHFLDRARAIVAPRPIDRHLRRIGQAGFNEEIAGEAHGSAVIESGDVIFAVLGHVNRALVNIPFAAGKLDLLVVEYQKSVAQRPVHHHFEIGVGVLHRAQIATVIVGNVVQPGPLGIVIGDANLFDAGKIDHANVIAARVQRASFDVVFDVLGKSSEEKLITGAVALRLHDHLFPLGSALVTREEADLVRLDADGHGGDDLVGIAADGNVARSHAQVVQRGYSGTLAGPEQVRAIANVAGAGEDHPHQHGECRQANAAGNQERLVREQLLRLSFASDLQRVGGEKINETVAASSSRSAKVTSR